MIIIHEYDVTPTGDTGVDSGRPRQRVVCTTCNEVLHENTTSPSAQQRRHEKAPMSTGNLAWIEKENHPDNGGLDGRNQHLQYMLLAVLDLLAGAVDSPGAPDSARDVSYQIGLARARGVQPPTEDLAAALLKYGEHVDAGVDLTTVDCAFLHGGAECSCGWDALRAKLEGEHEGS